MLKIIIKLVIVILLDNYEEKRLKTTKINEWILAYKLEQTLSKKC